MNKHLHLLIEIAGWYGMAALMIAYLLVSFGVITGQSLPFQLLNLTGALGIAAIAAAKRLTQSVILNLFWAGIALVALWRLVSN